MNKAEKIDYYISFAVFIQSFLIILQQAMISILRMDAEATTIYRVLGSASFMSLAIFFSFMRKKKLFIFIYGITFLILLLNMSFFPENVDYLKKEAFRFLLPMVISSAFCLMTVRSIDIVERALYHVSWLTFGLVLLYALFYLQGAFIIDSYNMSFSYGCLLPMVSLYRRRSRLSLLAVLFLFLIVISIGSRGAAMVFLIYVLYDVVFVNVKYLLLLLIIAVGLFLTMAFFIEWLDSVGIHSRTLSLLISDQALQDSGRGDIYDKVFMAIDEKLWGIGLYGDRTILEGAYCHNIFLEMIVNWGYIGVFILLPIIIAKLLMLYLSLDKFNKNRLICYTLVLIGPLMVSSSYLQQPNFGIYCGLIYLLNREIKKIKWLKIIK